MQLTPIGTSPAWYNPGEPSTGFLLEAEGFRMLIDCGQGVISRYLERYGADQPIDAIAITHAHADHVMDLVPLKYGMQYGGLSSWSPQLWLAPGVHERLRTLVSAWDGPSDFFSAVYDVHDYHPGTPFEIGPFAVDSMEVPHFIEAFALSFSHRGARMVYTSDLGPCDRMAPFAREADLLLCEATLRDEHDEAPDMRGHLSALEAGAIARDAQVHSLLLTHVPIEIGEQQALASARSVYDGPVALASAGGSYAIARRLAKVS